VNERAAFARLFQGVHEGVYIGTIGPDGTSTLAANPHLKLILGYGREKPYAEVRPFDPERFYDASPALPSSIASPPTAASSITSFG